MNGPRRRRCGRLAAIAIATVLLTACGGVSARVHREVPQPDRVAVLPLAGPAPAALREAMRQLVHSRVRTRGYEAPETAWVDRVLSEHGWLRDPATFDPKDLPLAAVLQALDVDGVVVGTGFDESRFNVLVLRRHALSGEFVLRVADGRELWSTSHSTGALGGFLLTSGQVFTELRAQGEHGSPMASLALADEFTADVLETLPRREKPRVDRAQPIVRGVVARRLPGRDGEQRIVVEAEATAGASLRFQLDPYVAGVPMVASSGNPQRYVGALDVPKGLELKRIAVQARDAYGREGAAEVRP